MCVNTRCINSTRGTSSSLTCKYKGHKLHQRCILWWNLCTLYLHACQVSYHRQLRSLFLYLCDIFWALINSLVCWVCTSTLGLVLFQIFTVIIVLSKRHDNDVTWQNDTTVKCTLLSVWMYTTVKNLMMSLCVSVNVHHSQNYVTGDDWRSVSFCLCFAPTLGFQGVGF